MGLGPGLDDTKSWTELSLREESENLISESVLIKEKNIPCKNKPSF